MSRSRREPPPQTLRRNAEHSSCGPRLRESATSRSFARSREDQSVSTSCSKAFHVILRTSTPVRNEKLKPLARLDGEVSGEACRPHPRKPTFTCRIAGRMAALTKEGKHLLGSHEWSQREENVCSDLVRTDNPRDHISDTRSSASEPETAPRSGAGSPARPAFNLCPSCSSTGRRRRWYISCALLFEAFTRTRLPSAIKRLLT